MPHIRDEKRTHKFANRAHRECCENSALLALLYWQSEETKSARAREKWEEKQTKANTKKTETRSTTIIYARRV